MIMKAIAFSAFIAIANAACPNGCTGHGVCGESTQCECYRNWFGADCSNRICSFGLAFVDTPIGDLDGDGQVSPSRSFDPRDNNYVVGKENVIGGRSELFSANYGYARAKKTDEWNEAHFYRECSNKGICDRTTGLCNCFPGYEGEGCVRTSCPNDCSGRGKCRLIADSQPTYSAWDREKGSYCVCDAGYTGPDCSLRSCPKGADPVQNALVNTDSVQGIYFRSIQGLSIVGKVWYTITMTDEYGDKFTTQLLNIEYKTKGTGATAITYPTGDVKGYVTAINRSLAYNPGLEGYYTHGIGLGGADVTYPSSKFTSTAGTNNDEGVFVDSLAYRLDDNIISEATNTKNNSVLCGGNDGAKKDGALCFFIKNSNPGTQSAYQISYFYNKQVGAKGDSAVFSAQTSGFAHSQARVPTGNHDTKKQSNLVVVVDAQRTRKHNPKDGDVEKTFIYTPTQDDCSKRGSCDYATGLCNCFSGYSGLRCSEQNAIAYSY